MTATSQQRPTSVTIDLDNLAFNYRSVQRFIGGDVACMAVVKADAYGHGAIECSRRLAAEGVDWFAVALPEEGVELRDSGISNPILCLGSFWPGQEKILIEKGLTPVICQLDKVRVFNEAARGAGQVANFHIKVDTGMGRLGVRFDEVRNFASGLQAFKNLRLEGLMTHFAAADDLAQNEFTDLQISRLYESLKIFKDRGFDPAIIDLANSPGAIAHPCSRAKMVRLGGILYGLGGDILPKGIEKPELRPILSLRSRISHLKHVPAGETIGYGRTFLTDRDSLIASVPIGYADGYPRSLSNKASALVNGTYVPVVGRISMDWISLDVTDVLNVNTGNEVVLIGEDEGHAIKAEDLAALAQTISYEITCGISRRVARNFVSSI